MLYNAFQYDAYYLSHPKGEYQIPLVRYGSDCELKKTNL